MSLYAKYIKELKNYDIVEDEFGFASYGFEEDCCYIEDIYVVPEKRKDGIASKYADRVAEIAKGLGYKYLIGSVVPSLPNSHYRQEVLLRYGFKLHASKENIVYYIKELK